MSLRILATLAAFVLPTTALFAADPPVVTAISDAYQINYYSNLQGSATSGDGTLNLTNTGASATSTIFTNGPAGSGGNICANIYVYAPDEEQVACCSCPLTPNELQSFPIVYQGIANHPALLANATQPSLSSVVVKIVATQTAFGASITSAGGCANGVTTVNGLTQVTTSAAYVYDNNDYATGLVAWATHSHPTNTATVAITETQFAPKPLGVYEAQYLQAGCRSLTALSGKGICSCPTNVGGLTTSF